MYNEVLELSTPALRYAVEMCEANPQYQTAVVISTTEEFERAYDIITDHLDMTQYKVPLEKDRILWKSGSCVRFVYPDDTSRGYNFTLMLFSSSLSEKDRKRAICSWCNKYLEQL